MQTLVAEVLAAWRHAERLVQLHPEGTPDHALAQAAALRLRSLYQELTQPGRAAEVVEDAADGRLRPPDLVPANERR